MIGIVALMFAQVISRYVLGISITFAEELIVILFIWAVYLGAIGATRRNEHLQIELISDRFAVTGRFVFAIISDAAFIVAGIFIINGVMNVTLNLEAQGMSTALLHIPKWICYMVIPFSFAVIIIRIIERNIHRANALRKGGKESLALLIMPNSEPAARKGGDN